MGLARKVKRCHGLVPWRFTLVAIGKRHRLNRCHGLVPWRFTLVAIRKQHSLTRCHGLAFTFDALGEGASGYEATNVNLHGTRPWHPKSVPTLIVATIVSLHGTRPWHQSRYSHNLPETQVANAFCLILEIYPYRWRFCIVLTSLIGMGSLPSAPRVRATKAESSRKVSNTASTRASIISLLRTAW